MENKKVIISYAYNGLIYFPLLLADYLNYFPKNFELRFSNGDKTALKELSIRGVTLKQSHIAVCDPLIFGNPDEFTRYAESGSPSEIKLLGAFIQKPPMWLFNNATIEPVAKEEDLKGQGIRQIRYYKQPNTGYYIGKRLANIIGIKDSKMIKEVRFNEEFNAQIENDEVVLTSNILRIAEFGFDKKNVIFSYPSKKSSIAKLFFTGILTRKDFVNNHFPEVLSFLNGLNRGIHFFYDAEIDELTNIAFDLYKNTIKQYNLLSKPYSDDEIKNFLNLSISSLRMEKIYPRDLKISKRGWRNNSSLRRKYGSNWLSPPIRKISEELPSILILRNWKKSLRLYFVKSLVNTPRKLLQDWFGILALIICAFLIYSFFLGIIISSYIEKFSTLSGLYGFIYPFIVIVGIGILVSMCIYSGKLYQNIFYSDVERIKKNINILVGIFGFGFTFILGLYGFLFGNS